MRDLLSKLDAIVSETSLNPKDPKGDYAAKKKALDDLERGGETDRDTIQQRRLDLDREAESKGVKEETTLQDLKQEPLAKDPVIAKAIRDKEQEEEKEDFEIGDEFGISVSEDFEVASTIVDLAEDGIVIELDETAIEYLAQQGFTFEEGELVEDKKKGVDGKACWKGYRYAGREKKADGSYKDKCVKVGESLDEAEYQGRKVPLGKPMKGDVKKSKVYVRNAKGNVVKVNFGDKKMRIKKSNPNRRKSFRARHNCANPGPRWKARYWSCRAW